MVTGELDRAVESMLTDDEIVAIAIETGAAWKLPLPTVDVDDAAAILEAGQRGVRSLALRGAYDADGHVLEGLRKLGEAVRDNRALMLFRGRADGSNAPGQTAYVIVPAGASAGAGAVLDSISAVGMHVLSRFDSAAAAEDYFTAVLEDVHSRGLPGPDDCLCLVASPTEGSNGLEAIVVSQGSIREITLIAGEANEVATPGEVATAVRAFTDRAWS